MERAFRPRPLVARMAIRPPLQRSQGRVPDSPRPAGARHHHPGTPTRHRPLPESDKSDPHHAPSPLQVFGPRPNPGKACRAPQLRRTGPQWPPPSATQAAASQRRRRLPRKELVRYLAVPPAAKSDRRAVPRRSLKHRPARRRKSASTARPECPIATLSWNNRPTDRARRRGPSPDLEGNVLQRPAPRHRLEWRIFRLKSRKQPVRALRETATRQSLAVDQVSNRFSAQPQIRYRGQSTSTRRSMLEAWGLDPR
jgi:hypothetical protein